MIWKVLTIISLMVAIWSALGVKLNSDAIRDIFDIILHMRD